MRCCDKAHGTCGNLLIMLPKHTIVPSSRTQSVHVTTSCLNLEIDLRE